MVLDCGDVRSYGLLYVVRLRGDHDDRNTLEALLGLRATEGLSAIHIWRHRIQEDEVRRLFANALKRFASAQGSYYRGFFER